MHTDTLTYINTDGLKYRHTNIDTDTLTYTLVQDCVVY